jgi:competence protein ComEC
LLFLVSNLLVVPAAFVIVSGGLLLLATSAFEPIATIVGFGLNKALWIVNEFVLHLHLLPFSKIDKIVISPLQVGLLFLTIVFISAFFHLRRFNYLLFGFAGCFAFFILQIHRIHNWKNQDEMVVYATSGGTAIDFISGQGSRIFSDNIEKFYDFKIAPQHLQLGISQYELVQTSSFCWEGLDLLVVNGRKVLIIRKKIQSWPDLENILPIEIDYLVISNNVKIPVDKIIQLLKFKLLIVDGSNYSYTVKYYKEIAEVAGVAVHIISEKGYYSTNL